MLKFGSDELQRIRNAVDDKLIFLVVDESNLSGTQYLNILVGALETPHVYFLYNCQPLSCSPNADSIVQAIDDAVTLLEPIEIPFVFYCLRCCKIYGGRWYSSKILAPQIVSCHLYSSSIAQLCNESQILLSRC